MFSLFFPIECSQLLSVSRLTVFLPRFWFLYPLPLPAQFCPLSLSPFAHVFPLMRRIRQGTHFSHIHSCPFFLLFSPDFFSVSQISYSCGPVCTLLLFFQLFSFVFIQVQSVWGQKQRRGAPRRKGVAAHTAA